MHYIPFQQPHEAGQSDPQPHKTGQSDAIGTEVKTGTQFIIVNISLYRLSDIL